MCLEARTIFDTFSQSNHKPPAPVRMQQDQQLVPEPLMQPQPRPGLERSCCQLPSQGSTFLKVPPSCPWSWSCPRASQALPSGLVPLEWLCLLLVPLCPNQSRSGGSRGGCCSSCPASSAPGRRAGTFYAAFEGEEASCCLFPAAQPSFTFLLLMS